MTKINVYNLSLDFDSEDKKDFYEFWDKFLSWKGKAVINPIYSDEGELMSFIVDSREASEILNNKEGNE